TSLPTPASTRAAQPRSPPVASRTSAAAPVAARSPRHRSRSARPHRRCTVRRALSLPAPGLRGSEAPGLRGSAASNALELWSTRALERGHQSKLNTRPYLRFPARIHPAVQPRSPGASELHSHGASFCPTAIARTAGFPKYLWKPRRREEPVEPSVQLLRGTLDVLILKTLAERGQLHGYGIVAQLESVTEGALTVEDGALYQSLHRMEERDWVESVWGHAENGKRAKFYRLTAAGRRQ